MKDTHLFSSKLFTISVSISIILCSISLLVFTISRLPEARGEEKAFTSAKESPFPWDNELRGAVGLGISKDTAYFVVFSNPNVLYKAGIHSAKDWYKN